MNRKISIRPSPNRIQSPPINVKIVVRLEQISLQLNQTIPSNTPFNVFIDAIAQLISKTTQLDYSTILIFHLQNGIVIVPKETKTLSEIGFENNCILYVDDRKSYLKYKSSGNTPTQDVEVNVEFFVKSDESIKLKELRDKIKNNIQMNGHKVKNCKIQIDFISQ